MEQWEPFPLEFLLLEVYGEMPAAVGPTVVGFHSDSSVYWVIPPEL